MCHKNMSVSLYYIFMTSWAWKFKNIKGTSFISTHTPIQECIIVLYKYLTLCAKGMLNPLFEVLFCFISPSCHLIKNWITKYFLSGHRGKYVLCLLFFKKIFKISKLLVALFYYFVWSSGSSQSKKGSIDHFIWCFSSLNLICIESL